MTSDFEHLRTPRSRTTYDNAPPPQLHAHAAPLPPRWRIIVGLLAFIVAALCFVTTSLLIQRANTDTTRSKQIGDLACQVQRLGGQPVDHVHCPPPKHRHPQPSSTSSPTPHKSPSVVYPPTFLPGVSGDSPTPGPTSSRATTQPTRSRSPSVRPSSPSPSATPSSCTNVQNVLKVCITPLALAPGLATFWWGGW